MSFVKISKPSIISSLGFDFEDFSDSLLSGEQGYFEHENEILKTFDELGLIEELDLKDFLASRKNYLDNQSKYALAATAQLNKIITEECFTNPDLGLVWASAYGNSQTQELFYQDVAKKGGRFGKPILFPHSYANTTVSLLSIEFGWSGFHMNHNSSWLASAHALNQSHFQVSEYKSPLICGASEALSPTLLKHFKETSLTSLIPSEGSLCFYMDQNQNSEFLLSNVELFHHFGKSSFTNAIEQVLQKNEIERNQIDLMIPYQCGDEKTDSLEREVISELFIGNTMSIFPVHKALGHTMGASTCFQIAAAMALMNSKSKESIPFGAGLSKYWTLSECIKENHDYKNALIISMDPYGNGAVCIVKKEAPLG